MFQARPFSINYLGKDGDDYNFFVNIGNINEVLYGTINYEIIDPSPIGETALHNGVYDLDLQVVEDFGASGLEGRLSAYLSPIKKSISLTETGPIYLKIPKIPIGSNKFNSYRRPAWFCTRRDFGDVQNFLLWPDIFEVTTIINEDDFLYFQKRDPLEQNLVDLPVGDFERVGHIYIKLADIEIVEGSVTIKSFFQSRVLNANRYITIGSHYNRGLFVNFFGKLWRSNVYTTIEGYYSRPDWIIMNKEAIFNSAKDTIESDISQYILNWPMDSFGFAESFELLQVFAVHVSGAAEKLKVKKIFEVDDTEGLFLPMNYENLPIIVPELSSLNAIIE